MAAAIAIAFTAIPSIASTFSSASLSNFTFTLVDLDLNDGIIPKITFGSNTKSYLGVSSDSSDPTKVLSIEGDNISPTMLTITRADYTASASVSGDNFDNKVLQVSGNSLGEIMSGIQYIYSGQVTDIVPFILSGKTQLNITADARTYVEIPAGKASVFESANSGTLLAISNALSDGRDSDSDGSSLTAFGNVNASAQNLNELVLLSVTVNNRDEREYTGLIISLLGTGGYSYSEIVDVPSEVPVPAALPLMASALGLFGLSRRKNNVAAV